MTESETRVCSKCDQPRDIEAFPRKGRGRHSYCCFCLSAYQKQKRGPAKKKPKPWQNPLTWMGHQHGELMTRYEDCVARTALLTMKAMGTSGDDRRRAWAAAYRAGRERDELRLLVMALLRTDTE